MPNSGADLPFADRFLLSPARDTRLQAVGRPLSAAASASLPSGKGGRTYQAVGKIGNCLAGGAFSAGLEATAPRQAGMPAATGARPSGRFNMKNPRAGNIPPRLARRTLKRRKRRAPICWQISMPYRYRACGLICGMAWMIFLCSSFSTLGRMTSWQ